MIYTVYRIVNKLNNKFYIGKHKTKILNDGYLGSGKLIRQAIKKYGKENFVKDLIHILDTEEQMNAREKELVILSDQSYNLCPGGLGGFGYINERGINYSSETHKNVPDKIRKSRKRWSEAKVKYLKEIASKTMKRCHLEGKIKYGTFSGKHHSVETKTKISRAHKGKHQGTKNSQFGTIWITNGCENKKIGVGIEIPNGWNRGRTWRK